MGWISVSACDFGLVVFGGIFVCYLGVFVVCLGFCVCVYGIFFILFCFLCVYVLGFFCMLVVFLSPEATSFFLLCYRLNVCNYLHKVTVNHLLNFSFVSCYDRDFPYDFTVAFLCLKAYSCCSFSYSLWYLSNVNGISQQVWRSGETVASPISLL